MAGLPHDRFSAVLQNVLLETLRALDFEYNRYARILCKYIPCEQSKQTVAPEDIPIFIYDTDPI